MLYFKWVHLSIAGCIPCAVFSWVLGILQSICTSETRACAYVGVCLWSVKVRWCYRDVCLCYRMLPQKATPCSWWSCVRVANNSAGSEVQTLPQPFHLSCQGATSLTLKLWVCIRILFLYNFLSRDTSCTVYKYFHAKNLYICKSLSVHSILVWYCRGYNQSLRVMFAPSSVLSEAVSIGIACQPTRWDDCCAFSLQRDCVSLMEKVEEGARYRNRVVFRTVGVIWCGWLICLSYKTASCVLIQTHPSSPSQSSKVSLLDPCSIFSKFLQYVPGKKSGIIQVSLFSILLEGWQRVGLKYALSVAWKCVEFATVKLILLLYSRNGYWRVRPLIPSLWFEPFE